MAVENPDDQYLRIFKLIDKADALSERGRADAAKSRYQEAQTNLIVLKKTFPTWNTKLVSYRLNYLSERIAALSQPPSATNAVATTAEATLVKPAPTASVQPSTTQVKLLQPGTEPRQVLRLHPTVGGQQTLVMSVKTSMDTGMGQAMVMPTMKMTLTAKITNISADGHITYDVDVTDASVADEPEAMPQLADVIKASLTGVKGLSLMGTLSDRGLPIGPVKTKLPAGSNPQAGQFIEQIKESLFHLACPLPSEAIGSGGKWEVKLPLKSQGMTIQQKTTFEAVSVNSNRVDLKYSITQTATNQKIENPAMPGLKLDVSQMTGNAIGTATLDLAKVFPSQVKADSHSELHAAINMGAQKQTMTMKTDTNVRIETK